MCLTASFVLSKVTVMLPGVEQPSRDDFLILDFHFFACTNVVRIKFVQFK